MKKISLMPENTLITPQTVLFSGVIGVIGTLIITCCIVTLHFYNGFVIDGFFAFWFLLCAMFFALEGIEGVFRVADVL